MEENYYELFGVAETATHEQIKVSFRKLAKQYHPDANPDNPEADAMFKRVNEAYETLSDDAKRAVYDADLNKYVSILRAPNTSLDGTGIYLDDYDRYIEPVRLVDGGGDIVVTIPILPGEIVMGAIKEVKFLRKEVCPVCNGTGAKHIGPCQLCKGVGNVKFFMDTAKGVETYIRPCKTCFGTGVQITRYCPKCGGAGMIQVAKTLRIPIPKNSRDGLMMTKKGDGDKVRIPGRYPGDLKILVKVARPTAPPGKGKK